MHESAQGSIVYILFYMTIHMYTYMYTLFTVLLVYSDKLTVYDKKLQNQKNTHNNSVRSKLKVEALDLSKILTSHKKKVCYGYV